MELGAKGGECGGGREQKKKYAESIGDAHEWNLCGFGVDGSSETEHI
jgi:hypothetical protein